MTININYFYFLSVFFTVILTVVPETDPISERMFEGFAVSAQSTVSVNVRVIDPYSLLFSGLKYFEDGPKISACWFLPSPPRKCW